MMRMDSIATVAREWAIVPVGARDVAREGAHEHQAAAVRIDPKAAIVLIAGALIIVSFQSFGSRSFFETHLAHHTDGAPRSAMYGYLYWFASSFAWLFVLPLAVVLLMRGRVAEFGLGLGDWRFGLRASVALYAVMLPVLIAVSFRDNFASYYPMSGFVREEMRLFADVGGGAHLTSFLIYEAAYASYFIGWEFFHRGFLTIGLERVLGWYAVLAVAIPFAILHIDKPMPEAYGAIVASIVLGWLAIRTRSSWYGFGLHAAIAVTMDTLAIAHLVG